VDTSFSARPEGVGSVVIGMHRRETSSSSFLGWSFAHREEVRSVRGDPALAVIIRSSSGALLPILSWRFGLDRLADDPTPEQFEADFTLWLSIDRNYAYFDVQATD